MDAGLKIELVFKRRIVNEILTTFLPTFLILAIVYATNFFKPFFFEAVVTVNLTGLLVLTTLFISVSGSLPPSRRQADRMTVVQSDYHSPSFLVCRFSSSSLTPLTVRAADG